MHWHEEGRDPDYRFSLANERTFLAWIRTALAILAGAILLKQFATNVHPRELMIGVAALLACLAGVIGAASYFRWRDNEHAMRLRLALPRAVLIPFLAAMLAVLGIVATLLVTRA